MAIRLVHNLDGYQVKTDISFTLKAPQARRTFTWNAVDQRNEELQGAAAQRHLLPRTWGGATI